ncbi:MAG TPA: DUF1697 domain-containing protein [Paenibacillus sp.]|nr:DUF1697 domain-containing protein [Paenibacillus sp.]
MRYVALLRGINVGGNNKIEMKRLKASFERAGMQDVCTYLNTGNVVFESDAASRTELAAVLESAILDDLSLAIPVLVRSVEDVAAVLAAVPAHWTNDERMRSEVMFLWDDVDAYAALAQLPARPGIDTTLAAPGALLWSVDRGNVTRSGMSKLIGTELYARMTIRNLNTARKIYELMHRPAPSSL